MVNINGAGGRPSIPKNWLTRTAPPLACCAACRPLVTLGLISVGVSSGVMLLRILEAPLWMALPVASAPRTNSLLSHDVPGGAHRVSVLRRCGRLA